MHIVTLMHLWRMMSSGFPLVGSSLKVDVLGVLCCSIGILFFYQMHLGSSVYIGILQPRWPFAVQMDIVILMHLGRLMSSGLQPKHPSVGISPKFDVLRLLSCILPQSCWEFTVMRLHLLSQGGLFAVQIGMIRVHSSNLSSPSP